jgi:hypothetical protein
MILLCFSAVAVLEVIFCDCHGFLFGNVEEGVVVEPPTPPVTVEEPLEKEPSFSAVPPSTDTTVALLIVLMPTGEV